MNIKIQILAKWDKKDISKGLLISSFPLCILLSTLAEAKGRKDFFSCFYFVYYSIFTFFLCSWRSYDKCMTIFLEIQDHILVVT
jgi:hypothetical protein